jgi:DNA-binding CsgD family transcriptional regulator
MKRKSVKTISWLAAYGLSKQEFALLPMIAAGHSDRKMSETLKKNHRSIQNLRRRVYAKLGVQSQAMARARIVGEGLLPAGNRRCPTCGRHRI